MYILRNKNIDVDIIPYLCEQNKTIENGIYRRV